MAIGECVSTFHKTVASFEVKKEFFYLYMVMYNKRYKTRPTV